MFGGSKLKNEALCVFGDPKSAPRGTGFYCLLRFSGQIVGGSIAKCLEESIVRGNDTAGRHEYVRRRVVIRGHRSTCGYCLW